MEPSSSIYSLNDQLYCEIIAFLSPVDFLNLSFASKFFHSYLSNGSTWKAYMAKLGSKALVSCGNLQVNPSHSFDFVKFAMKVFYSKLSPKFGIPLNLKPIESSTIDFNQSIDKVLDPNPHLFWSSLGSESEDSEESLIFLFSKYLVIPTSIVVTFFTAAGLYEEGTLEFPSKQISVEFSYDGNRWEYSSDVVDVDGKHQVQVDLNGKTGIARYMRVRLLGKTVLQPTDNLYYVAVQSVKCFGYQLDSQDKENENMNQLVISSWITWQIQEIMYGGSGGQKDQGKEIVDYYSTQEFSEEVYNGFIELLDGKENEAIWEFLGKHKFLLIEERTYVDIFHRNVEFGMYYVDRVINERKRFWMNEHETLMLMLIYVSIAAEDDNNPNIMDVLKDRYECMAVRLILYMSLSKKTFQKIGELTGKGDLDALNDLINHHALFEKPTDANPHMAGLVLLLYLSKLTFH